MDGEVWDGRRLEGGEKDVPFNSIPGDWGL